MTCVHTGHAHTKGSGVCRSFERSLEKGQYSNCRPKPLLNELDEGSQNEFFKKQPNPVMVSASLAPIQELGAAT